METKEVVEPPTFKGKGEIETPDCEPNWAELPRDVLMVIFFKMRLLDRLTSAGSVCRSWRKVAKEEPELWRKIDMTNHGYGPDSVRLAEPTRLAIDRSLGRLEEFSVEYFADDDLLEYLCDRTSVLKKLCLISCYEVTDEALAETAGRQPLLEEIQITFGTLTGEVTKTVGMERPQLKSFKLNSAWYNKTVFVPDEFGESSDDEAALGISLSMRQLRHLQLIGNRLTNVGLKAILDGCQHLETLDIRRCFNVNMDASMRARCARLKTIRFPGDSLDDYEFEADAYRAHCSDEEDFYNNLDYDYDYYSGDDDYDNYNVGYDEIFDADDDDEYMF